ncbi:winged helix-turn-helix domain-containing protein [Asanoa sp. WMMD1127]|uniref:GntR family transcriptional regulator n=1 Tax=Asanoa sp. WMMD1127 TaxID=3016107 RepID=UPI0024173DDF|nr:winged helix-turn-helix domain-containing protein [Asanoa sp. WMMD1127]MDG4821288.1 winged helix-turn-helix domain-containing protein [Asanoa sp. WMMD1127]
MELEIDYDGPVPVYRQLVNAIKAGIESGEFEPGRPIPSVARLQQETGLARGTILKAVAALEAEGLVEVVQGRGTYVTRA